MSLRRFVFGIAPAAACATMLFGVALGAQAAAFTNGSFELGAFDDAVATGHVMTLPVGSTLMTGWTITGGETAWGRNDNPFVGAAATNGNFLLDLTGFHDSIPYGGVSQTFDTVAGTSYSIGFDLITQENSGIYKGPVAVQASVGGAPQTFTFTPPVGSTGIQSGHFTLPFTATGPSTTLTIQGTLATGGQFIGLDNVTLPEPSCVGILALAGIGLMRRRRRAA
jgi:hypothetical protein